MRLFWRILICHAATVVFNDSLAPVSKRHSTLGPYFFATYLVLLWINHGSVDFSSAWEQGSQATIFLLNAFLGSTGLFLLPAIALTGIAHRLVRRFSSYPVLHHATDAVAIVSGALTTLFFYASAKLHELYGMFINGFVINLISTPGGIESLGASDASSAGFGLVALGILLGHGVLLYALRFAVSGARTPRLSSKPIAMPLVIVLLASVTGDKLFYAYTNAFGEASLLSVSEGIPYYTGMTARHFFRRLGFDVKKDQVLQLKGQLQYPAHPLSWKKPDRPYNIVWLVSESWRADSLNPEIMPATWNFSQKAQRFTRHYSGGNGTRVGVFTMLTGVPGTYWRPFLMERRGAAIIDVLQQQQYQMSLYTSAVFSYPEFDQTVFSQIPKERLHTVGGKHYWQRDRENVSQMLDFIDRRDPSKPFFTFMFFESPHARYYFPEESVIRRPYRDDINYATLSRAELQRDITLIKNRYLNAVHHLDSQFQRVLEHLESKGLLENTLVVMVGDHGEEFMENGYWGHNSTFSDPQVRTPLVLWIPALPGNRHDKITSHVDIIPTLMPLLGVQNPESDYTLGLDLLDATQHEHILFSDWTHVGYLDADAKITLPISMLEGIGSHVTGPHDESLTRDQQTVLMRAKQPNLVYMMNEFRYFMSSRGTH
ncbi:MAG: sulfatase-like hydrolase/transferase [Burkholderiales bacterium]